MTTVNIYMTFDGNCREAFDFYKSVFGGEFAYIGTFADMPPREGMPPVPESEKDRIMHVSLPVSKETALMGSDSSEIFEHATVVGDNISVSVTTNSMEEAERIFVGLSTGGKIIMPLEKTFWGAYYGILRDKFDINWMVNAEA